MGNAVGEREGKKKDWAKKRENSLLKVKRRTGRRRLGGDPKEWAP